jgi:hypothetical protein
MVRHCSRQNADDIFRANVPAKAIALATPNGGGFSGGSEP